MIGICAFSISACRHENLTLFSLDHYSQTISDWIKPDDVNYDKPLMASSLQQKHYAIFYNHYVGTHSPWNKEYINHILQLPAPDNLKTIELQVIDLLSNKGKTKSGIGYGENFQPHTSAWIDTIADNINTSQFENIKYNANNLGIAIDNLHARVLPTDDVHFYSYKIAGQGYPFDNLQISALWAGTPVYILGETRDHAWTMVVTPDFIAWVKSNGIARTNTAFINTWTQAAKKHLAAITKTQTSIFSQQGIYRFSAYVGSVFPAVAEKNHYKLMIPTANNMRQAIIEYANISKNEAAMIPMLITPHRFANTMSTLINRPYGWGNMYFYNDCSAELKSLFAPFGIWLPRHSSDQVTIGKFIDKTTSTPEQRVNYLMENGRRFMTIVYIGGHVLLYIGNYPNPNQKNHALMAMTYQDIWGLHSYAEDTRAVIGRSVLFPMLLKFPEASNLKSQANRQYFQLAYLDEPFDYLSLIKQIDLKVLMLP